MAVLREGRAGKAGRMLFVDNIRWVLMFLVVAIRVAVAYFDIGTSGTAAR